MLNDLGIILKAKPLGRPSKATQNVVRPGERNPIEAKFGQAKTGYGLDRVKARLQNTSESWIASIFLVLNLVKLAGVKLHYLMIFGLNYFFKEIIIFHLKNDFTRKTLQYVKLY